MSRRPSKPAERPEEEPIKELDDILEHVGGWDTYQKTLLVFFVLFAAFSAYSIYIPVLVLYVPDHWSQDDILTTTNPTDADTGERSKCLMYDIDYKQLAQNGASPPPTSRPNSTWATTKCAHGWTYNFTGYFTSAVTDMDWVCDDDWRGPFSQSMFFLGGMVGTLFLGWTGDVYGRFPSFFLANAVLFVSGVATPFCTTFASFSAMRFIAGLSYDSSLQIFYLLAIEYVPTSKRSLIGNLGFAVGFTLAGIYPAWLLHYLQDWKTLHLVIFSQAALTFVTPWMVHESLSWLAMTGQHQKCAPIIEKIAKTNGREVDKRVLDSFQRLAEKLGKKNLEEKTKVTSLFKTPRLRRHSILMIVTWILITTMFDCHIRNISNLDYSIYVTFTISSALELPADLLAAWGIDRLGRRWSAFISLTLSGLSMVVCAIFIGNSLLITVFSMVGRFFITYALNTGMQQVFEIFPTPLRSQGSAISSVFALLFQFFSPYIVYSSVASPVLPFAIIGGCSLLGAALSLNLPETAEAGLANTLEEAEEFGKDRSFFYMPMVDMYVDYWNRRGGAEASGGAMTHPNHNSQSTATLDTIVEAAQI